MAEELDLTLELRVPSGVCLLPCPYCLKPAWSWVLGSEPVRAGVLPWV